MLNHPKSHKNNPKRSLNGVFILDKPKGITSNAALQMVKRLFKAEKAGHTGSLDPLATGVLPICFGEATKFSQFLLESDKHYRFTAKLGIKTDSGDSEGNAIQQREVRTFSIKEIEEVLENFRGVLQQTPPMFSALKHQGQPLYKLARKGITVPRASREIYIYDLTLLSYEKDILILEVRASKGTYVRTLAEDIGEALGCGAHVIELRRLAAGPFNESHLIPLSVIEALSLEDKTLDHCVLGLESLTSNFPKVELTESASFYLRQGQPVFVPKSPSSGWVSLFDKSGRYLGVGEILEDGKVAPRRLVKHPA